MHIPTLEGLKNQTLKASVESSVFVVFLVPHRYVRTLALEHIVQLPVRKQLTKIQSSFRIETIFVVLRFWNFSGEIC